MTKTELKEQIELLQAQYDAMPDEPKALFEVAELGDTYYIVNEEFDNYSGFQYRNDLTDKKFIELGNHFTDKTEAERMAAFIRKNFLYWRMALKFADGYEWKINRKNYYAIQNDNFKDFEVSWDLTFKKPSTVYMTEQNARKFAEFCNENKEALKQEARQ
jgi:hypothetical protein